MKIRIEVPYAHPERTPMFAADEAAVDFSDTTQEGRSVADRCTVAFAATELASHLGRQIDSTTVTYGEAGSSVSGGGSDADLVISLAISQPGAGGESRPAGSFAIDPKSIGESETRVIITGFDRVGVLYGAYELLRIQGWDWLEPGPEGEYVPTDSGFVVPENRVSAVPAIPLWRGFDFSFQSMESVEFLLWMARNRLNLAGYRAATGQFGRKLGMQYKNGGHIFEKILDPDRTTEDGQFFWDAHRAWYGIPAGGQRTREHALRTQFCVSQPDLLEYLGEELVRTIESQWYEADLVAVWGFDTWGSCCTCESCRSLGNDSDQYLHLLSRLRNAINAGIATGRVRPGIRMAGCGYEGTSTLTGPENEVPQNLRDAGDTIIYYPIDRGYAVDLHDPNDERNRRYAEALASWIDRPDALPVIIGEYYNVSKFQDLPALFSARIREDLSAYHRLGVSGMTYMHVPMVNWAVRSQTQVLYAAGCWYGASLPVEIETNYFDRRYGPHEESMRRVYELTEAAWARIAEWRAWHNSILDSLLRWDGGVPQSALVIPSNFADSAEAVESGRNSAGLLSEAIEIVERCASSERNSAVRPAAGELDPAVNPIEAMTSKSLLPYQRVLGEDRRLLRYGLDTIEAMTETVALHDALYRRDRGAIDAAWEALESHADRLDGYWVPIGYEHPGPGLKSHDALSRSQLCGIINRCRAFRLSE